MMTRGTLLLAALARVAVAADPAVLTLYSQVPHTVEQGSVIRVPTEFACTKMEVRLPAAMARTGPSSSFKLHLDERDLHADTGEQNGNVVLTVTIGEPRGFFRREDQDYSLQVVTAVPGKRDPLPQWTIVTWKRAYVDISRSTSDTAAPDVIIDSPFGGAFVFPKRPESAMVQGSVTPEKDYMVSIAGETVSRDLTRSGWGFSRMVPMNNGIREIELLVRDPQGSRRQLFLPVH